MKCRDKIYNYNMTKDQQIEEMKPWRKEKILSNNKMKSQLNYIIFDILKLNTDEVNIIY